MREMMTEPRKLMLGNRVVGTLVDGVWCKKLSIEHFISNEDSFGFSKAVFDKNPGIKAVAVEFKDRIYTLDRKTLISRARLVEYEGQDKQYILSKEYFIEQLPLEEAEA